MASGKMCKCKRYHQMAKYDECKNCHRLSKKWGEEKDLLHVMRRDANLSAWRAPVLERLESESNKVAILKRNKRAA